ncbi:Rv0361 family membrane protein [Mycobacterium sp. URHB0021]
MSKPSGPDQPDKRTDEGAGPDDAAPAHGTASDAAGDQSETAPYPLAAGHEPATEIFAPAEPQAPERRFTAPSGFDGSTQKIDTPPEPATEIFSVPTEKTASQKNVSPQVIPPRGEAPKPPRTRRSWGWVVAVILVIAALVALAILGAVLLTRDSDPKASQADSVRATIQNFDIAIQNGDLATLRSITCGTTRDSYVNYDESSWTETHSRVAAAKQYPVVASIDQVVINGDHAEANVTTFMAYAPQTRSTRSFDLQFRDDQWKICQAATG